MQHAIYRVMSFQKNALYTLRVDFDDSLSRRRQALEFGSRGGLGLEAMISSLQAPTCSPSPFAAWFRRWKDDEWNAW